MSKPIQQPSVPLGLQRFTGGSACAIGLSRQCQMHCIEWSSEWLSQFAGLCETTYCQVPTWRSSVADRQQPSKWANESVQRCAGRLFDCV